jgi:hypothetical protein
MASFRRAKRSCTHVLMCVSESCYDVGKWQRFLMCALALAITVALGVIIDLNRPRSGLIHENHHPMIDLLSRP